MALKKIINLHAEWCAPCKAFASTFEHVSNLDNFKHLEFLRFDIEDGETGSNYVEKYHIRSVPATLMLDENDEQLMKIHGSIVESDFINLIKTIEQEKAN